jgi:hypothetical protein
MDEGLKIYAAHLRRTHKREKLRAASQDDMFSRKAIVTQRPPKALTSLERKTVHDIMNEIRDDGLLIKMKALMGE